MTWTPENLTFSEQQAQGPEPGRSWRGRGAPAGPGWGGVPYPVSSSARTNSYLAPRNHPATPRGVSLPTPAPRDACAVGCSTFRAGVWAPRMRSLRSASPHLPHPQKFALHLGPSTAILCVTPQGGLPRVNLCSLAIQCGIRVLIPA